MRPILPSKIGAELVLLIHSPEVLRWLIGTASKFSVAMARHGGFGDGLRLV